MYTLAKSGIPIDPAMAALLGKAQLTDADLMPIPMRFLPSFRITGYATGNKELVTAADLLDGGTGAVLHRCWPDPQVPTAECQECWITADAEAGAGFYRNFLTLRYPHYDS